MKKSSLYFDDTMTDLKPYQKSKKIHVYEGQPVKF